MDKPLPTLHENIHSYYHLTSPFEYPHLLIPNIAIAPTVHCLPLLQNKVWPSDQIKAYSYNHKQFMSKMAKCGNIKSPDTNRQLPFECTVESSQNLYFCKGLIVQFGISDTNKCIMEDMEEIERIKVLFLPFSKIHSFPHRTKNKKWDFFLLGSIS